MNDPKSIKELLKTEQFVIYPIKGTSMLPLLDEDRDLVKLEKATDDLNKYDVALFVRENGSLVLHRIIEVGKKYCVFCGDNQNVPEKIRREAIIAKAVGFYKDGKYVSAEDGEYKKYVESISQNVGTREIIKKIPRSWTALVSLLGAALDGKTIALGDNADFEKIYALACRHSVSSLAFRAVDKGKCPPELYKKWSAGADRALEKDILFSAERAAILKEFDKEKISYICLKGIVICPLYAEKGMREYADNDILYDVSRKSDVYRIMTSRGYEAVTLEGVHDSYHKAPFYNFELHKTLFAKNSPYYRSFENIWERAEKVPDGAEYKMTVADFYLHFIAHFAKHFSGGGTGVRYFCDLYLIKKKLLKDADKTEIDASLSSAGLLEFEEKVSNLSEKMFDAPDTLTYDDLYYIMESGTYGTISNSVKNGVEKKGKAGYFFSRMFLPYETLCGKYPVLRKAPILLPFCEIARLVEAVFKKDKLSRAKTEMKIMKQADHE
ncbi:MAG: nucleotidyltransferase family protein [Clostridia bacterium]|nr:nucleotidyltransferase family protein [Clostridia bacterium]